MPYNSNLRNEQFVLRQEILLAIGTLLNNLQEEANNFLIEFPRENHPSSQREVIGDYFCTGDDWELLENEWYIKDGIRRINEYFRCVNQHIMGVSESPEKTVQQNLHLQHDRELGILLCTSPTVFPRSPEQTETQNIPGPRIKSTQSPDTNHVDHDELDAAVEEYIQQELEDRHTPDIEDIQQPNQIKSNNNNNQNIYIGEDIHRPILQNKNKQPNTNRGTNQQNHLRTTRRSPTFSPTFTDISPPPNTPPYIQYDLTAKDQTTSKSTSKSTNLYTTTSKTKHIHSSTIGRGGGSNDRPEGTTKWIQEKKKLDRSQKRKYYQMEDSENESGNEENTVHIRINEPLYTFIIHGDITILVINGPTNCGKTMVIRALTKPLHPAVINRQGENSSFYFETLLSAKICLMEEPTIGSHNVNTFKQLLGGEDYKSDRKGQSAAVIKRIPFFITTNDLELGQSASQIDRDALKTRYFEHQFTTQVNNNKNITNGYKMAPNIVDYRDILYLVHINRSKIEECISRITATIK